MSKKYLIKNATIVMPDKDKEVKKDILIEGRKVVKIEKGISDKDAVIIDAKGKYVIPGMVDMHVHLRTPGQEYKEDISTGTKAAAAGGFTSVACMPNTNPVVDNPETLRFIVDKARSTAKVNVYPVGSITKGLKGEELSEMGLMQSEGAVSFSDDGKYVQNTEVMKNALLYARRLGVTLISHSEDPYLAENGEMNEGYYSTILGLKGIPALTEEIAIARDIMLAQKYGPVHIAHISTKGSVEIIRDAKKKGIPVTCETAPHYLWFTDEDVQTYNANFKMNPPLRGKEDRDAIINGLLDGTIDAVATDHAPHALDEKNCEFKNAAFGIIGLETAFGATIQKLYHEKGMSIVNIIKKLTTNPASILKIDKGTIEVGKDADIAIVDLDKEYEVKEQNFCSKASNSPFIGVKLKGQVVYTIVAGKVVYQDHHVKRV